MLSPRKLVGLEFDGFDDLTACEVFGRDAIDTARAWTLAAPHGRTRSLYDVVIYGGTRRRSQAALARKALRVGTLLADSEIRGAA